MKRLFLGFPAFLVAFLIGYAVAPKDRIELVNHTAPTEQTVRSETGASSIPSPPLVEFVPELRDLPNYDDIVYPESADRLIDVFETGGIYRESEVVAKSGETWLTLIESKGKYSLTRSKAKVQRKRTISYPGDEYDVRLTFDKPGVPIIATRNLEALKPGPVTTIYHRPSWKEIDRRNLPIDAMKTGYKREFNLNENWYTLRVSQGLSKDGTVIGVLLIELDGVSQMIAQNYHDPEYGETIGDLLWVGDLDSDGKLDLYFDEFNEKGYFGVGLYLSSEAEPGQLVKLVATFGMAGC